MNLIDPILAPAARGARSVMRPTAPVMIWAAIGAVFLTLAAYVWGSWLVSPMFRPAPVGADPLPENIRIAIIVVQALAVIVAGGLVAKFVVAPLFTRSGIGVDGLILLNLLLLWWTDPIDNYANFSFMYNAHTFNMGAWAVFIPGWSYPNHENLPEPILMMAGFYIGFFMANTLFGCWILRTLAGRWPRLALGWRIAVLFVALAIVDIVVENAIMRTGAAAYPGVVRAFSLYPGKVYQWPLYEAPIIAFINTGFTCLRFFKDDRGQTFVEKGIERLSLSAPRRKLLTFLALAGFLQPFFLIGYYLPYNLFVVHADTFPAYPSYMRANICGDGTAYACPSAAWVPIPHRGGKLFVGPNDPRLPQAVRDAQGIRARGKDPYTEQGLW